MELRAESGRREAARTATKRDGEVDWKAQHERRVAERRERTEHERIEAEKLQQQLDRKLEMRKGREIYSSVQRLGMNSTDGKELREFSANRTSRLRRSNEDVVSDSGVTAGPTTTRSTPRGAQLAYEVAQLNKKRDKLEDKVKKLERRLHEERGQRECDMALLRQSQKNSISEYTQKIQQLETELSQSKMSSERLRGQLERKDAQKDLTAARMAQLEEETVQLKSRLERHGSMKRRKDMFEQKAMELEKENLRLHSQLARELHRVKTEVDSRIVVQQEKLKVQAHLEEEMENAEKLRARVKRLERENDGMAKSLEANRGESNARVSRLEADLRDQTKLVEKYKNNHMDREKLETELAAKQDENVKLSREVYRLQVELERARSRFSAPERDASSQSQHTSLYPPRGERCRSLGDVSSIDSGMMSGEGLSVVSDLRAKVAKLQMYAEKAYQEKAAAEKHLLDSEYEKEKLKTRYKDEIHFLRQMNIQLVSDEAKESNLTEVLAMVKKAEEAEDALKQCESLELKVDRLQVELKRRESHVSQLEYQLLDKEAVVASLFSELDRHNVELDQTVRLQRRPEYRSASSIHSHLTTPTLCDSRQSLLQCDNLMSPFDPDARTDYEKISRSASTGPASQWFVKPQPLRRTNSEGSSPVFGFGGVGLTRQPFYSLEAEAHMNVALEAQAVARGLAELMQSGESLDQIGSDDGSTDNVPDGQPIREIYHTVAAARLLNFRPLPASNGQHPRFRRTGSDRSTHLRQSSGDAAHPRQSSGDSELSMPPSPGSSSCNTRITKSSASYCSSPDQDYYDIYAPTGQLITSNGVTGESSAKFTGIPIRPVALKPGSHSPLPQRPLSPRIRGNYFQPLTMQSVSSESEDDATSVSDQKTGQHLKQRSGSYESLKTDLSVSTSAVRGLHARLEQAQRMVGRHIEQLSISGDSSVFELSHGVAMRDDSYCENPEDRERLGSTTNYRPVQQYKKQGVRSASVGSLDNLRATRC